MPRPKDPNRPYDARGNPRRGVTVKPLPAFMHAEFRRFCRDFTHHAQSHYGTWKLAATQFAEPHVHANAIFWRSAIRLMSVIEAMGVGHATVGTGKRSRRSGR